MKNSKGVNNNNNKNNIFLKISNPFNCIRKCLHDETHNFTQEIKTIEAPTLGFKDLFLTTDMCVAVRHKNQNPYPQYGWIFIFLFIFFSFHLVSIVFLYISLKHIYLCLGRQHHLFSTTVTKNIYSIKEKKMSAPGNFYICFVQLGTTFMPKKHSNTQKKNYTIPYYIRTERGIFSPSCSGKSAGQGHRSYRVRTPVGQLRSLSD